jgi:hypothetical protein
MAAHRRQPTASSCRLLAVLVALGLASAPAATAAQDVVPDESALTEYVPALPGAEGPVLPGRTDAPAAPALGANAERELSALPSPRAAALRRLATNPSLGAPAKEAEPDGPIALSESHPSAVDAAGSAFPEWTIALALLLIGAVIAAAVLRPKRAREDSNL